MQRSHFDLSHEHKLSTDMGYLVPVNCVEVLPGDTFIGETSALLRVAPLVNPVMHKCEVRIHHWYVPNRIVWSGWDTFITGEDEGATVPTVTLNTDEETWLADHLGVAPVIGGTYNSLPFRAYSAIWSEFYRDQDLQAPALWNQGNVGNKLLRRICWEKDYFTIARPFPQQGDAVTLGFSAGEAPVKGIGTLNQTYGSQTNIQVQTTGGGNELFEKAQGTGAGTYLRQDPANPGYPAVYADLTNMAGGIDLNDLRRALALQRFAEARMRYGHRYADYLRYLGVNPSDGRLDRPEFLGGGSQNINFSEVIAMAEGTSSNVGDLYGHGIAGLRSKRYRKMFEEHGYVLSLLSVRPQTVYMESTPKHFFRKTAMDYWQKELEVLPWQPVYQNELHFNGDATQVFGYVPRYEEYRHGFSHVSGSFRDGPEKDWHMAREFSSPPLLNDSFVECTPTDRIYGDQQMPEVLVNAYNSVRAMRLVRRNATITGI